MARTSNQACSKSLEAGADCK